MPKKANEQSMAITFNTLFNVFNDYHTIFKSFSFHYCNNKRIELNLTKLDSIECTRIISSDQIHKQNGVGKWKSAKSWQVLYQICRCLHKLALAVYNFCIACSFDLNSVVFSCTFEPQPFVLADFYKNVDVTTFGL